MITKLRERIIEESIISSLIHLSNRASVRRTALEPQVMELIGICSQRFASVLVSSLKNSIIEQQIRMKLSHLRGLPTVRRTPIEHEISEIELLVMKRFGRA